MKENDFPDGERNSMPSIFISHTAIDKPFVEKLARDLSRVGLNVWFDKWEIAVGDSLLWKIENGIRDNEYLGVVLSPEAIESEWVKVELAAAWQKQLRTKKIIVLPIYYRNCDLPLFLSDRKYADFREDYQKGFEELVDVFGIKDIQTISVQNWRAFYRKGRGDWKTYRKREFEQLVTVLVDRAGSFNWSSWVGGTKNPLSITMSARVDSGMRSSVTIKLRSQDSAYVASFQDEINPNNLRPSDFNIYVGNTINECEEFVWRLMSDFEEKYGKPSGRANHSTFKFLSNEERTGLIKRMIQEMNWYKGDPT